MLHTWTKHIEMHYHYIWEWIVVGDINLRHVKTDVQTIDIFSKALGVDKLRYFPMSLKLYVLDLPSLRGDVQKQA